MKREGMGDIFGRAERLVGAEAMKRLAAARVIIFGVGGVGSWCAESLVRSGIGRLTIVDSDCVDATNVNRQVMATTLTVGEAKVEALRRRLLEINPQCEITALREVYDSTTAASFGLEHYDAIVDAIDSLAEKAELILHAAQTKAVFVASMGTARKLDAMRLQMAEFWKVKGCPLARALRERFKRTNRFPKRKFRCVFSDEVLPNLGEACEPAATAEGEEASWHARKVHVNGSMVHITATAGFMLAGSIIQGLLSNREPA